MAYNSTERSKFAEGLITLIDNYTTNKHFGHRMTGGRTHETLALKMKMQTQLFLKNPTDENWITFAANLNEFRHSLKKRKSKDLLNSLEKFIETSEFRYIMLPDKLSEIAPQLNQSKTINKPKPEHLMLDLKRSYSIINLKIDDKKPISLKDLITLDNDEDGKCVVTDIQTKDSARRYNISNEADAQNAIKYITGIIKKSVPGKYQNSIEHIIPFLSQNGVLQYPIPDILPKLLEFTNPNSLENSDHSRLNETTLQDPVYSMTIQLKGEKIRMTESYHYEDYTIFNEEGEAEYKTLLTPLEIVNPFECVIANEGASIILQNGNIQFSITTPHQEETNGSPHSPSLGIKKTNV